MARKTSFHVGTDAAGFSLVDMLLAVTFLGIMMAIAVPTLRDARDSIKLGTGAREVERELQTARLRAVTTNRVMRMRFNCPVAGEYRMVELIAPPGAVLAGPDLANNRCLESIYPYPGADTNPLTLPNHDGPAKRLDPALSFGAAPTLEFWPDGTIRGDDGTGARPWKPLPGLGSAVTIVRGADSKKITVNSLGKITLQ